MFAHLLKLVWNRKRTNFLLMLEIFAAFLVVFAVITSFFYTFRHYTAPTGYDHTDVWSVEITRAEGGRYGQWTDEDVVRAHGLAREVAAMEPVVTVGAGSNRPYSNTNSVTSWKFEGREVEAEFMSASDDYAEALGMELVQGRWFEPSDAALAWEPVVVNLELAVELFGDEDPVGRRMVDEDAENDRRVIGVLPAWRRGGEFDAPRTLYFSRAGERADRGNELRFMLIKVAPGTPADFEEPLVDRLRAIAPEWSFDVTTLAADRDARTREMLLPMLLGATVGGFLLIMVVLGLTGVMWQNVTRRTKEIGVRRAMGATRSSVHRQVVTEVMITASFGLLLGVLVVVQVPLLGIFPGASYGLVLASVAVAVTFMLFLAAGCGLYPGWSATRIPPAQALHYE